MKYIPLLVIAVLLLACHAKHPSVKHSQVSKVDSIKPADSLKSDTVDGWIGTIDSTHAGFKMDSVSSLNKALNLSISLVYAYPQDDSQGIYKRLVYHTIDTALNAFKKELTAYIKKEPSSDLPGLPNDFEALPVNFYEDNNIVSVRFIISSSTGATVLISELASINFDKRTHKAFSVKDYFDFKTREDSSLIINILEAAYSGLSKESTQRNLWDFYYIDGIDFNIKRDSISFNFSDYTLGQGPSMTAYKVSKERLKSLIRPGYQ